MKKIIIALFGGALLLGACQNEESLVFNKSADERVTEILGNYSALLNKPQYGWKATYFPDSSRFGGWSFWIQFSTDGTVKMLSDQDATTCKTVSQSLYRIGAIHVPTLTFDTYSYIHYLGDPRFGTRGYGFNGDFEFAFKKVVGDTLYFKALSGGSTVMLTPAKEEDQTIQNNYSNLSSILNLFEGTSNPYFKMLTIGDFSVEMAYNSFSRVVYFKYKEGGKTVIDSRGMAFMKNGVEFVTPIKFPGVPVPIKELTFSVESPTKFIVNIPSVGLTGVLGAFDLPSLSYTQGIKDLQREGIMIYNGGSASFSPLYSALRKAVGTTVFKSLQFCFNRVHPTTGVYESSLAINTNDGKTSTRYIYNIEWTYGADGVLRAKYLGTTNGAAYESKLKPIIDKLCVAEGWSVLDFEVNAFLGLKYYTVQIVSRKDSRDNINLASNAIN